MKSLKGLILTGTLIAGQIDASWAFTSPDIVVDSRLDYDWSGVLVNKFRTLAKNYNLSDPFSGKYPGNVMIKEFELGELLSPESKDFMAGFGNAVGLNMLKTETKISMKDFSYDVKGFKTNLKASEAMIDGLVMASDFSASEVNLSAAKITINVAIPGTNGSSVLNVDIIKPVIRASEDRLVNFFAQIKIQDNKDFFKFQIQRANFEQMANGLMKKSAPVELEYERIIVPPVSLKVGNKTVNFSPEKIERYIRANHLAIKGILLAQTANVLRSGMAETALKVVEEYKLDKEYWLASPAIQSQIKIMNFTTSQNGDHIEVNMPGDFCTNKLFEKLQANCVASKLTKTSQTRLNKGFYQNSVSSRQDLMEQENANLVASISEDYINKLLVTTYDAGLWKEALDEAGVTLGPNKVTMRLDRKGDSGTLKLDVVYKPGKIEKLITGSKIIRFPLVLDISVRIEKFYGDPVVIIRLNDVDTSDETLIQGIPEEDLVSTIKDVPRFQNKIAETIRTKLASLRNKDVLELRYPEFRGVGLDKVDFISDGMGRMNAVMRLEDLLQDTEDEAI